MSETLHEPRALLSAFRATLYHGRFNELSEVIAGLFSSNAIVQLGYPFETLPKASDLASEVYPSLVNAIPDLERRDHIVMSGPTHRDSIWVGCCGYYTGNFENSWLGIPPTHQPVTMRYHEFFRIENNQVCEVQAVWDIPELMLQAGVWPLAPSLGREWHVPGPATQDGIKTGKRDDHASHRSYHLVMDMLDGLGEHADGGVNAMGLEKYWHPNFSWYGPTGIGTSRGIDGFRTRHQIPFLNAMPDREGSGSAGHLFADGDYVAFTAWPGMHMTISGDGWLGIAPVNKKITMRSLDFWRCENGLIRENWVLIDLLDVYQQIGVDVFARMKEVALTRGR